MLPTICDSTSGLRPRNKLACSRASCRARVRALAALRSDAIWMTYLPDTSADLLLRDVCVFPDQFGKDVSEDLGEPVAEATSLAVAVFFLLLSVLNKPLKNDAIGFVLFVVLAFASEVAGRQLEV